MNTRKARLLCMHIALATLLSGPFTHVAHAADGAFPSRPVRLIVPFAAGTGTDVAARAVAEAFGKAGVTVIVDNMPGANGMLGARLASKAVPDGYTIFLGTSTTQAANPALYKTLGYDPVKDFEPIARIAEAPLALVVRPESPYQTAADFVAAVTARRQLSFASSSGATRIAGEMLKTRSGGALLHVPYKSSTQALTDIMGGQVDFMACDMGAVLQLVRAGKLRALAVTSPRRDAQLPDVPTFPEAGLKAFELMTWVAAFAPTGTPAPVTEKLNTMLRVALAQPPVQEKLAALGVTAAYSPSTEMRGYVRVELARWRKAAEEAGIEPE